MTRVYYYLFPIVRADKEFCEKMYKLSKEKNLIDVYLGDYELDKNHLYIHTKVELEGSYKVIGTGYMYKYPIKERFKNVVEKFLQGKYSEMYSSSMLKELLLDVKDPSKSKSFVQKVLTKDPSYTNQFIKNLHKSKLIDKPEILTEEWKQTTELDIPPKKEDLLWKNTMK